MSYPLLEDQNVFVIPVGDFFLNKEAACSLVYSPLANVFFLALPKQIMELEQHLVNNNPNKTLEQLCNYIPFKDRVILDTKYEAAPSLYLLLNEKCNFHCEYCYSAEGRSNKELSIEQAYITLEYFLSNQRQAPKMRTIMFMGGGEPTLSWHLVEQATNFAEKIATENRIILKKRLTTNGSILTSQMLNFYKTHHFTLQFSFDIIAEVQNKQRDMFDKVSANLKRLGEEDVICTIRSTITTLNVDRIPEMVELCHIEYPKVKRLICEPVVNSNYFINPEITRNFYDKYFNSFIEAQKLAKKYNIELFSSISDGMMKGVRNKFHLNLYCLTPYGTITNNPDISSPKENGYEDIVFGEIYGNKIIFDDKAYQKQINNMSTYSKCVNCWAKWNCGGGRPDQRRVYEPHIFNEICSFMKRMLRHNLIHELAEKHEKATGKNFFEDITNTLKKQ